jgi:hypothetical protein
MHDGGYSIRCLDERIDRLTSPPFLKQKKTTSPPKMSDLARQGQSQFHEKSESYNSLSLTHLRPRFRYKSYYFISDRAFKPTVLHVNYRYGLNSRSYNIFLQLQYQAVLMLCCDVNLTLLLGVVCSLTKLGSRVSSRIQVEKSKAK